jgi:hypothetical protein
MDAATDAELRLARRLKLGVRLVVYPALLVLLVVAWHARQARGEDDASWAPPKPTAIWNGTTDQGRAASVSFIGDKVFASSFDLSAACSNGGTSRFTWAPNAGLYRKRTDGHLVARRLPIRTVSAGYPVVSQGSIDLQRGVGELHGLVSVHWEWFDHGVRAGSCDATDVAVTLRGG